MKGKDIYNEIKSILSLKIEMKLYNTDKVVEDIKNNIGSSGIYNNLTISDYSGNWNVKGKKGIDIFISVIKGSPEEVFIENTINLAYPHFKIKRGRIIDRTNNIMWLYIEIPDGYFDN